MRLPERIFVQCAFHQEPRASSTPSPFSPSAGARQRKIVSPNAQSASVPQKGPFGAHHFQRARAALNAGLGSAVAGEARGPGRSREHMKEDSHDQPHHPHRQARRDRQDPQL